MPNSCNGRMPEWICAIFSSFPHAYSSQNALFIDKLFTINLRSDDIIRTSSNAQAILCEEFYGNSISLKFCYPLESLCLRTLLSQLNLTIFSNLRKTHIICHFPRSKLFICAHTYTHKWRHIHMSTSMYAYLYAKDNCVFMSVSRYRISLKDIVAGKSPWDNNG